MNELVLGDLSPETTFTFDNHDVIYKVVRIKGKNFYMESGMNPKKRCEIYEVRRARGEPVTVLR